jgi:phosphoribosylamine--glycine ligase
MKRFADFSKDKKIDFVLASGLPVPRSTFIHDYLKERKIPYLFVNPKVTDLERSKHLTKQLLAKCNIPTPDYQKIDGRYLYKNFKTIPRPFVVKLDFVYQSGRQTIVVDDENYETVFEELFGYLVNGDAQLTNIALDTEIVLEEYLEIKREYSYHALFNQSNWKYLGSARDYKKLKEGDVGYNTVGLGCYNVEADPIVHEYADKIYNFLKEYLGRTKSFYRGFIFLGIAVDKNNVPHILEINTRSGDPELCSILGSIENDLSELFYAASADLPIPDVVHNNKSTVSVRVFNRIYDWLKPASFVPKFENIPNNIIQSIETCAGATMGIERYYIKHSLFTTTADTRQEAAKRIYDYLDTQYIGQFTYRRDIGYLE